MANFTYNGNDLDNIFMTTSDLVDQYRGNRLWSFGSGLVGQLGNASTKTNVSSPATTSGGGITWESVSASDTATNCWAGGVKTDGTLWTWGYNLNGQLGDATTKDKSSPVTTAGGGTTWKKMWCGGNHAVAVKTDGTLWTWGSNARGQLGDGTTNNRSSPGTTAGGGTNWSTIVAGTDHCLALKTDGTLWTWGSNFSGALGEGTTVSRSSPGTTSSGGTTWLLISAGTLASYALKTDGTLWTWGINSNGQLGEGSTTSRRTPGTTAGGGTTWKQLGNGNHESVAAIKIDGTLWTWGANDVGQLGDGTTNDRSSPGTTAGGGTNWLSASCGGIHSLGIKTDGSLWSWGNNAYGQLGTGNTVQRSSPGTTVATGVNWRLVTTGANNTTGFSFAIDTLG